MRSPICRKWLPTRKGYDLPSTLIVDIFICRKWLPTRKGYDSISMPVSCILTTESKMASDSEGLRHSNQPTLDWFVIVSKMASDSEGLRQFCEQLLLLLLVENGFRLGRVTTFTHFINYSPCKCLSKMASDFLLLDIVERGGYPHILGSSVLK